MIDPFRLAFDVRAPQDHAFDVYTRDIDRWWPAKPHADRKVATC